MAAQEQKTDKKLAPNSTGKSSLHETKLSAKLPSSNAPSPASAELSETRAQLTRLASGLRSQLKASPKQSGLAARLQLETRLLGGATLSGGFEQTTNSTSQFEKAASSLKALSKSPLK